jgi:hypothetical protein
MVQWIFGDQGTRELSAERLDHLRLCKPAGSYSHGMKWRQAAVPAGFVVGLQNAPELP